MGLPINEILDSILAGDHDTDLDMLASTIRDRQHNLTRRAVSTARAGQTGRLNDKVRPMYLNGAPLEVIQINRTRIVVRIDQAWLDRNPRAKARWSGRVTCPIELVDLDPKE